MLAPGWDRVMVNAIHGRECVSDATGANHDPCFDKVSPEHLSYTEPSDEAENKTAMEGSKGAIFDKDVLNYLLNIEYLEANYYLVGLTGSQLATEDLGTIPGEVIGGRQVNFSVPIVKAFVTEIAMQARAHVQFLRKALGAAAVPCPWINLVDWFSDFGQATQGSAFDPFVNETNFLVGSYVFEDVGVTAYRGALTLLQGKEYVDPISGMLAAEACHATMIRTLLFACQDRTTSNVTQAIAQVRSALAHQGRIDVDDHGIGTLASPHVTNLDSDAIAFGRSTAQVLNVVYGASGRLGIGGSFFPKGFNGRIR